MTETSENLCRRALLLGLGAAGATAVLAACGGSGDPASAPTGATGTNGTGTDPAPASKDPSLAKLADVPVGGGILVGSVMVVQPQAGVVKAFDAHCTHQQAIIDPPEQGVMTCPKHGSKFNAADGARISGLAQSALRPIAVKLDGDKIVRA